MSIRFRPARSAYREKASPPAGQGLHQARFEMLESRCLLSITSAVVGRYIFYDNSKFDGSIPGVSALDDGAIATDKSALMGDLSLAAAGNATSYSRGINGIMVDITGSHSGITNSDFTFKVGNNNSPGSWVLAPDPSAIVVRANQGFGGADRVEIIWNDLAIANTTLQVIVAANDNTGLAVSDVFFFANHVGDTLNDSSTAVFVTNSTDQVDARDNFTIFGVTITNLYDFDRNGLINSTDQVISRDNFGFISRAKVLVTPPSLSAQLSVDTGPDGTPNSDGITTDSSIQGTLTTANSVASFKAGLSPGSVTTDATSYLSGSNFALDEAFLETLNGEPLDDGPYVLHLQTVDAYGVGAAAEVAFTLKTSITPAAIPDLIAADDTGASSTDNITKTSAPRIAVTAETASLVRIYVDGSPVDVGTGGPGLQFTLATLSDGPHNIYVVSQDGAGNSSTSPTLPITVSTVLPTISASTLVAISSDLTPHVNVAASGPLGLPNGTQVTVDVDLDFDGNFAGAGELNRTTSTLYNGKSYFQVTPALPPDLGGTAYWVQLRARVTDIAGNEGTSTPQTLSMDRIGNTVLDDYVTPTSTPTYSYAYSLGGGVTGFTSYVLDMTSQTWRTTADVNMPVWHHWLQVIVPANLNTANHSALLFISGDDNDDPPPTFDLVLGLLADMAITMQSIVVYLPTVPNQPLTFTGDPGNPRREDEIIAYTVDQYANHLGEPGNETWPALLPMVQSAVAAMDTTQHYVPTVASGYQINDFIVTGYSKRGWTTWLTAAVDDRVRAIIPGVIEMVNMGEQMVHHWGAYGFFSPAIGDYLPYEIPQESYTVPGQETLRVIDPFTYIYNGKYDDMPKLLINSSGDQFFLPDAAEFYFSDLPGTDNYLRYVPNTSHSLNFVDPINSTKAFFHDVVSGNALPEFSWSVGQDGSITVQSVTTPTSVKLWKATNPSSRDFRKDYVPASVQWVGSTLTGSGGTYVASVTTPMAGATAFFVELTFPSGLAAYPHVFTTQIKVATSIPLVPWPFYMPANPPPAAPMAASGSGESGAPPADSLNAVAVALAASSVAKDAGTVLQPPPLATAAAPTTSADDEVDNVLASDWSWADADEDESTSDDEADEVALLVLGEDWH